MSTIILKVDLECCKCNKKIRKTLCELQDRWKIQTIIYDEKKGTVTISGPFDAKKLSRKLCCKACKVIKDIQIPEPPPKVVVEKPPPPPPPPKVVVEEPPPPPPPPKVVVEEPPPPPPPKVVVEEPPPPPPPKVVVEEPPPPPPPPKVVVEEPPPPPPPKVVVEEPPPPPPALVYQPVCCCWYHGVCRCCWCGRAYGAVPMAPPPPPPVSYNHVPCCDGCSSNSNYKNCEIICVDQDPSSCTIM